MCLHFAYRRETVRRSRQTPERDSQQTQKVGLNYRGQARLAESAKMEWEYSLHTDDRSITHSATKKKKGGRESHSGG